MAKNHYVTKRNRRPKNKRRKDYTAETMRKLKELRIANPITLADLRLRPKPIYRMYLYTPFTGGAQ